MEEITLDFFTCSLGVENKKMERIIEDDFEINALNPYGQLDQRDRWEEQAHDDEYEPERTDAMRSAERMQQATAGPDKLNAHSIEWKAVMQKRSAENLW